jgi:hypothetical protein
MRKGRGGRATPHRTFWPRFILYPALALGAVMMVMALRVGFGHALEGHSCQKISPTLGFAAYSADHSSKWDKPLTMLAEDGDDDDGGDSDDDPTS